MSSMIAVFRACSRKKQVSHKQTAGFRGILPSFLPLDLGQSGRNLTDHPLSVKLCSIGKCVQSLRLRSWATSVVPFALSSEGRLGGSGALSASARRRGGVRMLVRLRIGPVGSQGGKRATWECECRESAGAGKRCQTHRLRGLWRGGKRGLGGGRVRGGGEGGGGELSHYYIRRVEKTCV